MSVSDTVRHDARCVIFETYPVVGYNYRMTDIQGAIGREQLKRVPQFVSQRRRLAGSYDKLLEGIPQLETPAQPEWAWGNWQSYCVTLPLGCDQREVMQHMLDAGVATRRGIMCTHREPAYQKAWTCGSGETACTCSGDGCLRLQKSEAAEDKRIILPFYHQITKADQVKVTKTLRDAISSTQGVVSPQRSGLAQCRVS